MVVRAAGYSKGTALTWLAQHYSVRPDEVVAVGDWLNDVPMFGGGSLVRDGAGPRRREGEPRTDRLNADTSTGGGIAEAALRAAFCNARHVGRQCQPGDASAGRREGNERQAAREFMRQLGN